MSELNKPFSRKCFHSKSEKETNSPNVRWNKSFIKALAWGLDELNFGPPNLFSGSEGGEDVREHEIEPVDAFFF